MRFAIKLISRLAAIRAEACECRKSYKRMTGMPIRFALRYILLFRAGALVGNMRPVYPSALNFCIYSRSISAKKVGIAITRREYLFLVSVQ